MKVAVVLIALGLGAWVAVVGGRALTLSRGSATYGHRWTSRLIRLGPLRLRAQEIFFGLIGSAIALTVTLIAMKLIG